MDLLSLCLEIILARSDEGLYTYTNVNLKSGDFFPEGTYEVTEKVYDEAENFARNVFFIYVREGK